jgi:hypothetical protein
MHIAGYPAMARQRNAFNTANSEFAFAIVTSSRHLPATLAPKCSGIVAANDRVRLGDRADRHGTESCGLFGQIKASD